MDWDFVFGVEADREPTVCAEHQCDVFTQNFVMIDRLLHVVWLVTSRAW